MEYNLPVLARKWDKIDLSRITKQEQSLKNFNFIKIFYSNGFTVSEIAKKVNLTYSRTHAIIKKIKNNCEKG